MSGLKCLNSLNVSNNPIENIEQTADALLTLGTNLVSIGINLHEEDQVDYLLRTLAHLRILNGIEVEREALFDSDSEQTEQ